MSQNLFFYEQSLFIKKTIKQFSHEEVDAAVRRILLSHSLEDESELRESLFKDVEVSLIEISAYGDVMEDMLKIPDFFIPESRFFMVKSPEWKTIDSFISDAIQPNLQKAEEKKLLKKERDKLRRIFNQKSLFVGLI